MQNKKLIVVIIALVAIIVVFSLAGYLIKTDNNSKNGNISAKLIVSTLNGGNQTTNYTGEQIIALDLLKKYNIVNTTSSSQYGEFVNCINNICSNQDNYWMYYVNGQLASVGAGAYFVQDNDTVEFTYIGTANIKL